MPMLEQMTLMDLFNASKQPETTKTTTNNAKTQKGAVKTAPSPRRTTANATSNNNKWSGIKEQTINDLLLRGSGFSGGKKRIYDFFLAEKDEAKRAEMLKNEYGTGGSSGIDGCHDDYSAKGYRVSNWNTGEEILLSWRNVAERIGKLIHYHLYYA